MASTNIVVDHRMMMVPHLQADKEYDECVNGVVIATMEDM
jgi:hypothetical protein